MRSCAASGPKRAKRRLPPTKAPKVISSRSGWIPAAAFVIKGLSNPSRGDCYMRLPLLINLQKSLSNSVVATTRARSSNRAVDLRALGIVRETRFACPGKWEKLHASEFGHAQDAQEQIHKRKRLSTGTLLLTPSLVRCPGCTGVPQENR